MEFTAREIKLVLERCLSYLDVSSAVACSAVCKMWYRVVNEDDLFWKRVCKMEFVEPEWQGGVDDTLEEFCEWKQHYINSKRTIYNWKKNKATEREIKGNQFVCYDGRTLLTSGMNNILVHRIFGSEVQELQTLYYNRYIKGEENFELNFINIGYTNTNYIALHSYEIIYIYKLDNNDRYVLYHTVKVFNKNIGLYEMLDHIDIVIRYNPNVLLKRYTIIGIISNLLICNLSIRIHGNNGKLYSDLAVVRAWDMDQQKWRFSLEECLAISVDKYIYVLNKERNKIIIYDEHGTVNHTLTVDQTVDLVEITNQFIVTFKYECNIDGVKMSVWRKNSFELEVDCREVRNFKKFYIHKTSNVMFHIPHLNEEIPWDVTHISDNTYLWSMFIRGLRFISLEIKDLFIDLKLASFEPFPSDTPSSESVISVRDIYNGTVLYEILSDDTIHCFKCIKNILVYGNIQNEKLNIRLYS